MEKDQELRAIREKFAALSPAMNEAARRRWVAAEARALGRGGLTRVALATGVSAPTIRKGMRELASGAELPQRIRRAGAGRKRLSSKDASLLPALEALVRAPSPRALLQWSPLTPALVLRELRRRGHSLSAPSLLGLLGESGYSWYTPRGQHDAPHVVEALLRWRYLEARIRQFLRCGQPVLTLELQRGGASPELLSVAPSVAPGSLGPRVLHASPGEGAPELIGAAVRSWWRALGPVAFSQAGDLLLVVGQQRALSPRWQRDCEDLADALGLRVQICLLPGGTYRWRAKALPMTCYVVREWGTAPRIERSLRIGLVSRPDRAEERLGSTHRLDLSAAAYPNGLIDREGASAELWTLQARPRTQRSAELRRPS